MGRTRYTISVRVRVRVRLYYEVHQCACFAWLARANMPLCNERMT